MKRKINVISNQLHIKGYAIYKNAIHINDKIYNQILKQINKKGKPIFNSNKNDNKRLQCNLSYKQKFMKTFINDTNNIINTYISDQLKITDWVVLQSKSGCTKQLPHCDYIQNDEFLNCDNDNVPCSVIVALMDNTTINVFSNSIKLDTINKNVKLKEEKLILSKGDIFIFRGDLVHAGSAYNDNNIRLHAYLDSNIVHRTKNRTFIIDVDKLINNNEIIDKDAVIY